MPMPRSAARVSAFILAVILGLGVLVIATALFAPKTPPPVAVMDKPAPPKP
jgi:hypothetical protein